MTWREQLAIIVAGSAALFTPVYLILDGTEHRRRARRCDKWASEWAPVSWQGEEESR